MNKVYIAIMVEKPVGLRFKKEVKKEKKKVKITQSDFLDKLLENKR